MEDDRPAIVRAEEIARDAEREKKKGRFAEAAELHTSAAELFSLASRATEPSPSDPPGVSPTCTAHPTLRFLVEYHLSQARWARAVLAEVSSAVSARSPTPTTSPPSLQPPPSPAPDASNLLTSFYLVNKSRQRFLPRAVVVSLSPSPPTTTSTSEQQQTTAEDAELESMASAAMAEGGPKTRAVVKLLMAKLDAANRRCRDLEKRLSVAEESQSTTPLHSAKRQPLVNSQQRAMPPVVKKQ